MFPRPDLETRQDNPASSPPDVVAPSNGRTTRPPHTALGILARGIRLTILRLQHIPEPTGGRVALLAELRYRAGVPAIVPGHEVPSPRREEHDFDPEDKDHKRHGFLQPQKREVLLRHQRRPDDEVLPYPRPSGERHDPGFERAEGTEGS
ncbi:C6 zinc finger domain-containing protein [Colletotrichum scovillei]|uniref:C6 zinc finger domain-containing protein n=1 Tax=Colletotrichum scovillei TaxID=1209932 RepID=A0A9P7QZZ7_9PEZI|nr:C6 zinc finger domain-containing protein [Colletotrichum scovillei]KAG7052462.1 C6 zinc finger domain-containing protein [Colletotrichum scovillei]KAG7064752.1 C6 zinc finger domain-containing protein [Colletotrichum scovillei]